VADAFSGTPVAVLGDLVLDRFWYGAVQRISREAPVPIVRLTRARLLPGCAANTVWNLAALGAEVRPVGVTGEDETGRQLLGLFREAGLSVEGIVARSGWETPTKTRILAGTLHGPRQQLVRVDSGEENPLPGDLLDRVRSRLAAALDGARSLVLSDYGYGLVAAAWRPDLAARVPIVALDSRFGLLNYPGLTTATPNEEEFEEACGDAAGDDEAGLAERGEALRARQGLKALLVTRGARGMALFQAEEPPSFLPIVGSDQVVDVTGAGDTVISTYVLALCAGASFLEAAALANVAGGIVVQKHGTAATNVAELKKTLQAWGEGRL
jgi:rfaE bifunctional protein kinase chain/domain